MSIDLYFMSGSAPCRAVLMTAKHLNVEVNIKNIDLSKLEHLTPEYLKLNPTHKIPTLVDQDLVLWESRAIMQYLCDQYAPDSMLYPKEPKKRAVVDKWLYTDMSYSSALVEALVLRVVRGKEFEPNAQQIENYKTNLKLIDTLIGDRHYVAGDELTIADLTVLSTTTYLLFNEFQDLPDYPNLKAWYERIQTELPYYQEVNGNVPDEFLQLIHQSLPK